MRTCQRVAWFREGFSARMIVGLRRCSLFYGIGGSQPFGIPLSFPLFEVTYTLFLRLPSCEDSACRPRGKTCPHRNLRITILHYRYIHRHSCLLRLRGSTSVSGRDKPFPTSGTFDMVESQPAGPFKALNDFFNNQMISVEAFEKRKKAILDELEGN